MGGGAFAVESVVLSGRGRGEGDGATAAGEGAC